MRKFLQNSLLAGAITFGVLGGSAAIAQAPGGQAPGGGGAQPNMQPSRSPGVNNPNDPMSNEASATKKVDDKKFAKEAALGGLTEVELGKLAAQKASSDAVKQFGQKMVDDHSKANDELKQIASRDNLNLPTELDKKHQSMVDKMSALSGPAFDKAYVKNMVKDHEQDVKEFQEEAENGTDPNVKQFASKTLPVLQEHLSSIKEISKTSGK
jgi:putative membrane protein